MVRMKINNKNFKASFSWDCSSIGQSTALSRRKLRVRAPSVPTLFKKHPFSVKRGTGWFEDPLVKGKGEQNSGAEPYDARVYTLFLRERDPNKVQEAMKSGKL